MSDADSAGPAPPTAPVSPLQAPSSRDRAWSLYRAWRNTHLAELPVEFFHRLEAAAEHLVAAIEKEL